MTHGFDKDYWEQHWHQGRTGGTGSMGGNPPNPYLARETSGLAPGTALDAGCGSGAEAIWLASHGWHVTAADISSEALARAADWVSPGGTLLIVGHLHTQGSTGHGHHPPAEASVTSATITARIDGMEWEIVTAEEHTRTLTSHGGRAAPLHDVVVRATRRR
jgi:SAM-dependent methyltransferase